MFLKSNDGYSLDHVIDHIRVPGRHRANRAPARGVLVHFKNVQSPTEDRRFVHIGDRDPDHCRVTERPQMLEASIYVRVGHLHPQRV